MKYGIWILAMLLASCFIESRGDDLKLRNGKVYSNYLVTYHNSKTFKISFRHSDGSRKNAVIAPEDLPLKLQRKYFWKDPEQVIRKYNMSSIVREFADDLKVDLADLSGKGEHWVRAAIDSHNRDLRGIIAVRGEDADFRVEHIDSNGAWLKVVSVKRSSNLKSGQYIYLHGFKKNTRFFSGNVYPTGCRSNNKKFNNAMIYGATVDRALEISNRYIGNQIRSGADLSKSEAFKKYYSQFADSTSGVGVKKGGGDEQGDKVIYSENDELLSDALFKSGCVKHEKVKTVRFVNSSCSSGRGSCSSGTRSNCSTVVSSSCSGVQSSCPGKKPSQKAELQHKSIVQRNNGHSGNYGVLPEHLAPGRKSGKSIKPIVQRDPGSSVRRGVLPERLMPGKPAVRR